MPEWQTMLQQTFALEGDNIHAKFFQVANVDETGLAQNRTMVFRGFDDELILAVTDIRSDKVAQWQQQADAQLCWYFNNSREQFRMSCKVVLITQQHLVAKTMGAAEPPNKPSFAVLRNKIWNTLSEASQAQFNWPSPKVALDTETHSTNLNLTTQQYHTEAKEGAPHEHFVLVCFEAYQVDYLNLNTIPQTRHISTRSNEGSWALQKVHA